MKNVIHIAPDSSHSVHLAKMLSEVEQHPRFHIDHLLIVPGATHGRSVLDEIRQIFPRSKILQGNINFLTKIELCIFHGMFLPINFKLIQYFNSIGIKLIWVVWGGDLYRYSKGNFPAWTQLLFGIIGSELDSDLLDDFDGLLFSSPNFYMPKNEITRQKISPSQFDLEIIVGNSGDPSNRHREILETLRKSKLNLLIRIPLAYNAAPNYRAELEEITASNAFSHEVLFQNSLMSTDDYALQFAQSDLAIYHHPRQQAVGSMRLAVKAGCGVALDFEIPAHDGSLRINPSLPNLIKMGATKFYDTNLLLNNFSDELLMQVSKGNSTFRAKVNSDESMQVKDYIRLISITSRYDKK